MNITNSYNPEEKRVLVFVESNLLVDYFPNFQGLIKKDNNSINDLRIEKLGKDKAMISFPLPREASVMRVSDEKMAVSMPTNLMEKLTETINRFTNAAIRKKLKTVEFLPLSEYPEEDLRNDMIAAVKAQRNFCILNSYSEYKEMSEKNKYDFSQIMVYYGTNDYADIALDIWKGNIQGLRERLDEKFEKYEWI